MKSLRGERILIVALSLLALLAGSAVAQVTTIRITDRVEVEDVLRLGMHLTGNNWYDSPLKKMRVEENFEGTIYRQCQTVDVVDGDTVVGFTAYKQWPEQLRGGTYIVLSGPDRWTSGRIERIVPDPEYPDRKDRARMRFELDKKIQWHPEQNGLLITSRRLEEGRMAGHRSWKGNTIVAGDTPPESFGHCSMRIPASENVFFPALDNDVASTNGTWKVHFWAKRDAGSPLLEIGIQQVGEATEKVRPADRWESHQLTFHVDQDPEPRIFVNFSCSGGDVLVDDIQIWQEGDRNPTDFRDDVVSLLREHSPGVMRLLHNDGNTMRNVLMPPLRAYASRGTKYGSIHRRSIGMHEFYELCEELGCAAWANLPGTLTREEVEDYIEYLGAPPDVGLGKLRARMGHPQPWTESLPRIYVQYGNESMVTFPGTSYNGPDYWEDLTRTAKNSPYCTDNIVFTVEGFVAPRNYAMAMPNADVLADNNYLIRHLDKEDLRTTLNTRDKLFRYVFAWPYWKWTVKEVGTGWRSINVMRDFNMEGAIYEGGNYHLTHGDAPSEPRNDIVAGIGGQVSAVNSMLFILKEYGIRAQNQFNLAQFSFTGGGSFGSGVRVRLWGQVTSMRPENRRLRPGFLASMTCNKVIGADLVETTHEGADPTFDSPPMFEIDGEENRPMRDVPVLYSYGFKEGDRRGLIITSLDTSRERPVEIQFDGRVAGGEATRWLLTADDITANNEPEHEPQVHVRKSTVEDFGPGYRFRMPPYSLVAFEWETR